MSPVVMYCGSALAFRELNVELSVVAPISHTRSESLYLAIRFMMPVTSFMAFACFFSSSPSMIRLPMGVFFIIA